MSYAAVTVWHEIASARDPWLERPSYGHAGSPGSPVIAIFSFPQSAPQNNVVSRLHLARVPGPAFLGRSSIFSPSPVRSVPAL